MKRPLILFFALVFSLPAATVFELTDSSPGSAEFQRRFMASYGVNEAVEPKIPARDRPLYEKIEPLLAADPRRAIEITLAGINEESSPAFHFLLGNLYYQIDDLPAAEKQLQLAVEQFPSFRRAYRTLALIHVRRTDFAGAVEPLLNVIRLGGGDEQSYGLLAYSYLNLQQPYSALNAYRMARMFKPDSFDFKRGEAQCLMLTQQDAMAIALFDELIVETPTEKDFWLLQAKAYLALDRRDDAIANLELARNYGTPDWRNVLLLGELYLAGGNHQLAIENYKQAALLNDTSEWEALLQPLAYLTGRRMTAEAGDYLDFLKQNERFRIPDREKRILARTEAQIAMETDRAPAALQTLETLLREDPLDGASLMLIGEYFQRTRQFENAELHLERAAGIPEFQEQALVALGRLAVAQNQLAAAVDYLRKAQALTPRANVARYLEQIQRAMNSEL
jgi:tetratricopeptide (TPR) repeat protein